MNLSRRNFLRGLLLTAGGLALSGCNSTTIKNTADKLSALGSCESAIEFPRQIVAADNGTGRTIMWQTKPNAFKGKVSVLLREVKSGQEARFTPTKETFTGGGETHDIYTSHVSGLNPGSRYEYAILHDSDGSEPRPLATDDGGSFECLIFPDSQSSDYSGWEKLAQGAAKRHPDTNLFINMGDLVDNGEQCSQWKAWFSSINGIIDRKIFIPVMGNHETYDLNWKVRRPRAYLANFAVPGNDSRIKYGDKDDTADFDRWYYSFDYGPAHFVVLNTQQQELAALTEDDSLSGALTRQQDEWLKKDLTSTDKRWKIVLMHRDVLRYGIHNRPERQPGIEDIGRHFMPLFEEFGVDVVLTAHLHTYRNRGRLYDFEPADRGPLYVLTGVAGNVRYPGLWIDHDLDRVTAPQPETDNYLTMKVTKDNITLECFLPDGTAIDKIVI